MSLGSPYFDKTHWCSHRVEDFACVEINAGEVLHRQRSPVVVSKPLALLRRSQRSRGLNINQPTPGDTNKVWVYMGLRNGHSPPSTFFQWRIWIINYINSWGNLLWGVVAGSPLNLGLLLSNNWRNTETQYISVFGSGGKSAIAANHQIFKIHVHLTKHAL